MHLTGRLAAAETSNKKGVYAISYYDGGYRQCYSMLTSHQLAGGIPSYTHVTHFKPDEFTLDPLDNFLNEEKDVTALMALFAGDLAEKFYKGIEPLQQKYDLHLYVSPMMLDETLSNLQVNVHRIKGYAPWVSTLDNPHNYKFKLAFEKQTKRKANYFAVLGWETGVLLREINEQYKAGNVYAADLLPLLCEKPMESPRDWFKIDPETYHSYGASWLLSAENSLHVSLLRSAEEVDKVWKSFIKRVLPKGESSSWKNTYLCI